MKIVSSQIEMKPINLAGVALTRHDQLGIGLESRLPRPGHPAAT
jgi:hypothetical protein